MSARRFSSIRHELAIATVAALIASACGPPRVGTRLATYREHVQEILSTAKTGLARGAEDGFAPEITPPTLPRRRLRRLDVSEQRIRAVDFLGIMGCPLSEIVAARNTPMGRVLEPTRRLHHETRVVASVESCLPSLEPERAARLRERLTQKRNELGAHVWNAVWLDADLERYLGSGPRALLGGSNARDAPYRLADARRALGESLPEQIDAGRLELAFEALRDDEALGPALLAIADATLELEATTRSLRRASRAESACGTLERRLVRVFEREYLPLQAQLSRFDRRAQPALAELHALFVASSAWTPAPAEMRAFAAATLDPEAPQSLWPRFRRALLDHASAWNPVLVDCGVIPEA